MSLCFLKIQFSKSSFQNDSSERHNYLLLLFKFSTHTDYNPQKLSLEKQSVSAVFCKRKECNLIPKEIAILQLHTQDQD